MIYIESNYKKSSFIIHKNKLNKQKLTTIELFPKFYEHLSFFKYNISLFEEISYLLF